MKTQWITCNACGADAFEVLSKVGEWTIGKCSKCGLVHLNPAPFFEPTTEFSTISKGFQYTQYQHQEISPKVYAYEREQLIGQQKELARMTGQSFPHLRYLEVGCGSGAAVRAASDLGWQATGIDIDPELIEAGVRQHGADLRCVPLLQAGFPERSFDFIRLRDVIEHLPNPFESLKEVYRLLRPGGIVLLVAPNEGAMLNRARRILGLKRRMVAYAEPPHHIHGFTPPTLKKILQRANFDILSVKTTFTVDSRYVTSNNMRSSDKIAMVSLWKAGNAIGMGNFIVAWAQR